MHSRDQVALGWLALVQRVPATEHCVEALTDLCNAWAVSRYGRALVAVVAREAAQWQRSHPDATWNDDPAYMHTEEPVSRLERAVLVAADLHAGEAKALSGPHADGDDGSADVLADLWAGLLEASGHPPELAQVVCLLAQDNDHPLITLVEAAERLVR